MGTLRVICLLVIVWDAALHFDGFGSPERPLRGVSALTQLQRARRGNPPLLLAAVCHSSMPARTISWSGGTRDRPKKKLCEIPVATWEGVLTHATNLYSRVLHDLIISRAPNRPHSALPQENSLEEDVTQTTTARYGHRQLPASVQLNFGCILPLTCECRIPEHQDLFVNGHQLKMQKENQFIHELARD
jgi:hypothetical protein